MECSFIQLNRTIQHQFGVLFSFCVVGEFCSHCHKGSPKLRGKLRWKTTGKTTVENYGENDGGKLNKQRSNPRLVSLSKGFSHCHFQQTTPYNINHVERKHLRSSCG